MKKEYTFEELGYFTESTMEKIKEIMDGESFMNFEVAWSNCAGNCTLIVKTDYEDTEENIKGMFLAFALNLLAEHGW